MPMSARSFSVSFDVLWSFVLTLSTIKSSRVLNREFASEIISWHIKQNKKRTKESIRNDKLIANESLDVKKLLHNFRENEIILANWAWN